MVSCDVLNGEYQNAFLDDSTFDILSGLYCPFYDSMGSTNAAAVVIIFGLAAYVGLVNRNISVLAIYLVLSMSSLFYLVVWAPFSILLFLAVSGSLGFGLFLLYKRLGSTRD